MTILQATHDIRKVALWLGHASVQTSEIYTRTDPMEKLNTIAAITPPSLRKGTFEPPEKLIALLKQQNVELGHRKSPKYKTFNSNALHYHLLYITINFWGPYGPGAVFYKLYLKHNSLEPDGCLMRIGKNRP